ncbi:hypothetical protein diail_9182 [Diaporthe ilicicola]|nr:hypothetical protein diail_9182 [Diaporthe ilicicola]
MYTSSIIGEGTGSRLSASKGGVEQLPLRPENGSTKSGPKSSDKGDTAGAAVKTTPSDEEPPAATSMTQNVWLFMFRGRPSDLYNRRHVLLYLDSPDVDDFHFTTHAQRPAEGEPFEYVEIDGEEEYPMRIDYLHGRLVGATQVSTSQRRKLVDVIASTPVGGEPEWNCQHFVYHALERLSECGVISPDDLNALWDWMMDCLLDGAAE